MKKDKNYQLDAERQAENLIANSGIINDEKTYNIAYENYFMDSSDKARKIFKPLIFDILVRKGVIPKESLFEQAGGKDLARDRKKTAKRIVKTPTQYVKAGAQKVDLRGVDTRSRYIIPAKVGERTVYAKSTYITIRGKRVTRLRDQKGRFAKRLR